MPNTSKLKVIYHQLLLEKDCSLASSYQGLLSRQGWSWIQVLPFQIPSDKFHYKDLNYFISTFSVGQMLVGIFEWSQISKSNEEPKDKSIENDIKSKTFDKGKSQSWKTHPQYSNKRYDSMRKFKYLEVDYKKPKISKHQRKGIDNRQIAYREIVVFSWVLMFIP